MKRGAKLACLAAALGALATGCGGDGAAGPIGSGRFARGGIIEGFYGEPYAHEDRLDLIRFLGEQGLDRYVYAPKNDPYHRARWRDPYPAEDLARFAELAEHARRHDVRFGFAISPTDLVFTNEPDVAALLGKLDRLFDAGVRSFTLSFDDTLPLFRDPGDLLRYGFDVARAHAELANRVHAHLLARDPAVELLFTPMDYNGTIQPYSYRLGELLDPDIPIFWTGPTVYSATLDAPYHAEVASAMRRPPLIWDNFPVNDTIHYFHLHLGPYVGRDPALDGVISGILLNTMLQPRASKVAIAELARFLAAPSRYDAERAWEEALDATSGGSAAFRRFAQQSRGTPLDPTESVALERAVNRLYRAFDGDELSFDARADELSTILDSFTGIRTALEREVDDPRLLTEIDPWITRLEQLGAIGLDGLAEIRAARGRRPAPDAARRLDALALASVLDPTRMCGDAIARFLTEGADRVAVAPTVAP